MAKVEVSRSTVTSDNQLIWELVTIDETDLQEGEEPYTELVIRMPEGLITLDEMER